MREREKNSLIPTAANSPHRSGHTYIAPSAEKKSGMMMSRGLKADSERCALSAKGNVGDMEFKVDEATHTYTLDGERIPSVTEIVAPLGMDYDEPGEWDKKSASASWCGLSNGYTAKSEV